MLFPAIDQYLKKVVIGFGLGLGFTIVAVVLVGLLQVSQAGAMTATATPTKTATQPATATASPTATPSATVTPSSTATPSPTATATETSTPLPTDTSTPLPPTATPLPPTPTLPPVLTQTLVITEVQAVADILSEPPAVEIAPAITDTLALTQSQTLTNAIFATATPTGPPTPTPTPVPRTVQVPPDFPDFIQAKDHFWFTRPFSNTFDTWGSYYYPYGTNARGQYFWHYGIDIQNPQRTPILAVGDGTVIHAGPDDQKQLGPWPDFYGQAVVIEHTERWHNLPVYTLYGHVSEVLVGVGQQVKAGQPIALVGQLGVALGPHLHLEVRVGAGTYYDTRNPDLWVRPDPGYGVIAGRVVDYQNYFVPQQLVTLHRAENPGKFWRQTYTYPDGEVNPDDEFGETFTFSDVPAGKYVLKTYFDGHQLTVPVTVPRQGSAFALLKQTEPPQQPQPQPTATALPEPQEQVTATDATPQPATDPQAQ